MKKHFIGIILSTTLILSSCVFENREDLFETPVEVSFSTDVQPLIQSNCISCHSQPSPNGNVPLENYDDIKAAGTNGSLLNALKGENGVSIMPPAGALPASQIELIETWINDGMPNN
ncbi:MAG: hypothetical protein AB8G11_20790 [Saprospiraceae bacterium]